MKNFLELLENCGTFRYDWGCHTALRFFFSSLDKRNRLYDGERALGEGSLLLYFFLVKSNILKAPPNRIERYIV